MGICNYVHVYITPTTVFQNFREGGGGAPSKFTSGSHANPSPIQYVRPLSHKFLDPRLGNVTFVLKITHLDFLLIQNG